MSPSEFISEPQPPAEPQAGRMVIPIWLIILTSLLLYWAATYFDGHGGWFSEKVYWPFKSLEEVARLQPPQPGGDGGNGKQKYEFFCATCHNIAGTGNPGQAPPLAGSAWVVDDPNRVIPIPQLGLAGPIEVNGQQFNLAMPNMGASLSDRDLADLLSYIRNSWGNKAPRVTAEQVKTVRADLGNGSQQITAPELKARPNILK